MDKPVYLSTSKQTNQIFYPQFNQVATDSPTSFFTLGWCSIKLLPQPSKANAFSAVFCSTFHGKIPKTPATAASILISEEVTVSLTSAPVFFCVFFLKSALSVHFLLSLQTKRTLICQEVAASAKNVLEWSRQ